MHTKCQLHIQLHNLKYWQQFTICCAVDCQGISLEITCIITTTVTLHDPTHECHSVSLEIDQLNSKGTHIHFKWMLLISIYKTALYTNKLVQLYRHRQSTSNGTSTESFENFIIPPNGYQLQCNKHMRVTRKKLVCIIRVNARALAC